jgi:hypothetical protein
MGNGPGQSAAFNQTERARWARVIKYAAVKME